MEKEIGGKEKEGKRERGERSSNFSLRSTEIDRLVFVGPRTKDHLLDKGYVWVLKTRDFTKDSSEEFRKSRVSGLGSVHGTSKSNFYALRGRSSLTLVIFYLKGCVVVSCPKGDVWLHFELWEVALL